MKSERARSALRARFLVILVEEARALNRNYIIFKNYTVTQSKAILLTLFAIGAFDKLLAGETPMVREKSKNSHIDCKGSGCTIEEVDKIRKVKMEGKRGQRPKKNAFSKPSAIKY